MKGLRVVVRAGRCLRNRNQMPSTECQAWICCTQLNSFIYFLLFVTVSVSISKYLALTTWRPQHTSLHVLVIGRTSGFQHPPRQERILERDWDALLYVGAGDGKVSSSVITFLPGPHGILEFSSTRYLKAQTLSLKNIYILNKRIERKNLSLSCVVSSTGQFICHPVYDPRQGQGGPCPEGGGDSQWEPRRDDGELAPLEQPSSEGEGIWVA